MGARLFTALVPPAPRAAELDAFLAPRRLAEPRLRWTHPDTWHLTTAFMAEVGERHVDPLVDRLAVAASRTPAFHLRLGGAGVFGPPDAARLLWIGVTEGAEDLAALALRTRTAAERAGVRTDGARFTPHLTVARASRPLDVRRLLGVIDTFAADGWRAEELLLVESHPADRSNRYEIVERFALACD